MCCVTLTVTSIMLQKTLLRFYLFEGLRYVWLDRKGAFCRVRYWKRKTRSLQDFTEYWAARFILYIWTETAFKQYWFLLILSLKKIQNTIKHGLLKYVEIVLFITWICLYHLFNSLFVPSLSVVSSMRTGPARTCMASKKALVTWSRAWGRRGSITEVCWLFNLRGQHWVIHDMNSFRRRIYGPNLIYVPVKSYMKLLFEEVRWKSWSVILLQIDFFMILWLEVIYYSLSLCFFRSSTHSMCSRSSASHCGCVITIICTPSVFYLSPCCPSGSLFMRLARWVCSGILNYNYYMFNSG